MKQKCQYYVNSLAISCIICQKEEKEFTLVKYFIYAVLLRFQICHNFCVFFHQICNPKVQSSQKMFFSLSALHPKTCVGNIPRPILNSGNIKKKLYTFFFFSVDYKILNLCQKSLYQNQSTVFVMLAPSP